MTMAKKREVKLTRQKYDWAKNRDTNLVGEPLRVNEIYANRKAEVAMREVRRMHLDVSKQVKALFHTPLAKETIQDVAMDASITSQARILTNRLMREWGQKFNLFAKEFSDSLFDEISGQTGEDMRRSMEKMTGSATINSTSITSATKDVIAAGTQQSTSLIKSISGEYMGEVQEALMRSIASPKGNFTDTMKAIDEMLQGRFKRYKNKAKNVTLDQTRKAYSTITDSRMRSVGIAQYTWRHAGGSQEPRQYHKNVLNGQVFDLDDPPIIDQSTGERGQPGTAINCKCFKVPLVTFGNPNK
jgi:SPP1 gp7 family putative phage head morphogenesis protein